MLRRLCEWLKPKRSAREIEQARYQLEQERLKLTNEILGEVQRAHKVELERQRELQEIHELLQDWATEAYEHFGTHDEAENIKRQLRAKRRLLHIYRDRAAMYGPSDVPPHLTLNIEIIEDDIERLQTDFDDISGPATGEDIT